MREKTCKNEQDARIRIIKKALTPFPIRCECSIRSKLSAIPFPLCRHISRSFDGLCCMKPTTKSEVLVLLVFLATVPASLTTDRASTCTRYVDIATSHENNSDLSNQLRRVRFLKEGEKIKRFMYLLMSEILFCVIILVQLLHVTLIHQPKLTLSENAILGCIHDCLAK